MPFLQDLVHKIELAVQQGRLRSMTVILGGLLLALCYNLRDYRNFATEEAMDCAQLGRQIAGGRGYTTLFIRPFSLYLVSYTNQQKTGPAAADKPADPARIREGHPDIANPPVYPVLLAGLMKVLPFNYSASSTQRFWSSDRHFWRYQPDFLIALFNQVLLAALIVLSFLWARRLFDPAVAWTSAAVLLGADLLWRFSASGLSTMLLLLVFMGLVWCLTGLEAGARTPNRSPATLFALAAAAGLLLGLGGLTRYAFGWLVIPVLIFVGFFTGAQRGVLCLITLAVFAAVMTPWIARNYQISGAPFGLATYSLLDGTDLFPGSRLERSLAPSPHFFMSLAVAKLLGNLSPILENPAPLGGWISAFFLAGLLISFRNPGIRRMRFFLLACLGLLIVVQALGRTHLSDDSPEINSENLLVLLLPLIVIYGISLFFTLLDQLQFPTPEWRFSAVGLFALLACSPLVFTLMSRTSPVAYPPYHPLLIQQTAAWMKADELMMSDIPWAVAWYGNRQCVWLTLNAVSEPGSPDSHEDFLAINEYQKPVQALYLTQKTTDSRFVSDWVRSGEHGWGVFIMDAILKQRVPPIFPLHQVPTGYMPEQLFLSDWKRWQ